MSAKPSKYRSVKVSVDGITFHSKAEARRYGDLKTLQRAGEISRLELQPKYPFAIGGRKMFDCVADFTYLDANGVQVVEDVKGLDNPVSALKRKITMADRGIEIRLVDGAGNRKRTPTGRIKK